MQRKNKRKGKQICMVHGYGIHNSDECKLLQAQAKRIKLKNTKGHQQSKGDHKNFTWSRKALENKEKAKKDLQAFVQE